MIQLIVNVNLLREIDERKLIRAYARFMYNSEIDVTDDIVITQNLINLLDWDKNGDNGLGIYCGKFESLKRKDIKRMIDLIKTNKFEIKNLSYSPRKVRRLENIKKIFTEQELKEQHNREVFTDENYKETKRGKKAVPCEYHGKIYLSRQECQYKEGITKAELYRYLATTNQLDKDSQLLKKYEKS